MLLLPSVLIDLQHHCSSPSSPQPNRLEFINYLQNVNNFRNDIWKSILTTLHQSTLFGADLVELNSLLHTSLQSIFEAVSSSSSSNTRSIKETGSVNLATLQQQTQPTLSNLDVRLQCTHRVLQCQTL